MKMSELSKSAIEGLLKSRLPKCQFKGVCYWSVEPCGDTEEIAECGPRLMFRHGSPTLPELTVFTAPKGVLTAGFVIGIFAEDNQNL